MWRILGASVIGTSHINRGSECQDAHAFLELRDGTLIVAVADGAGSASRSAEGAKLAVETAVRSLADSLQDVTNSSTAEELSGLLRTAVTSARARIEEYRATNRPDATDCFSIDDFATTLILLTVTKGLIGLAQVGDGVAAMRANDSLLVLTPSSTSEYVNETTFLTSQNYLEAAYVHVQQIADVDAVAAMSDGMQMLAVKYADNSPHPPFFIPLFRFAGSLEATDEELASFLRSDRVCSHTDDDKTIVVAVRSNGATLS
jgi:hypothetical protein